MCHALLHEPAFFHLLTRIDAEHAEEIRQNRCPRCKGALHVSDYPRKPRGCPPSVIEAYSERLSFTCGRCEKRTTPASVRFLARRVYVALALMLFSGSGGSTACAMRQHLKVSVRTVKRWRTWWHRDFQRTAFWRSVCERFASPVPAEVLPQSLLERFQGPSCQKRLEELLRFARPLSTTAMIK